MLTFLGAIVFIEASEPKEKHLISISRFQSKTAADKVFDFAESIDGESDRGVGILSATLLDIILEDLIFVSLKGGGQSELFGKNGLFSSFSSKIDYCSYAGLIGEGHKKNLNIIRRIRNDFAHQMTGRFGVGPVADRVRALDFWNLAQLAETDQLAFRFRAQSYTLMLSLATRIHYLQMRSARERCKYEFVDVRIDQEFRSSYYHRAVQDSSNY